MKISQPKLNQSGQLLALALIVITLVMINTVLIIGSSMTIKKNSTYSVSEVKAISLAEAGIDKAIASFNSSAGNYSGESETSLGDGSYGVTVTSSSPTTIRLESTGYIPNKTNPSVKRTVSIQLTKGVGISFIYGMLVGNGGIIMGNGSTINGSIYANGNIAGGNNETISGDVYVAGGTQPTADQQNDCTTPNCADFTFGKNVSGQNQLDVAQSFKPTITAAINKLSLKLKKIGSPANITVRILADNNNKPNKSVVLGSGVLSANLVTSQYNFVDVALTTNPVLTANTPYWIMLDSSADSSNYWMIQNDTTLGYTRGAPAWSPDWQASNPVWNNITGDLSFKTWMGGVATTLTMNNGSVIKGNVHANTISGITINKDAYYQLISNSTVKGVAYPNSVDPAPIAMPISDANIAEWQDDARSRGVTNGSISGCPAHIGPGKIAGDVTINNSCTITATTPIWITGNLSFGNSGIIKMDPALGAVSGVIIVGGITSFSNGDDLLGTGTAGSYLTLLSTYNSQSNGITAINTNNSSITGILYAPFGTISLANNANFKEAVAWKINMGTGTILTYDSGLTSTFFSSGPGGSYSVISGTYKLK